MNEQPSIPNAPGRRHSISIQLRLSAAIQFFAGTTATSVCMSHGMSVPSVYESIWMVVDAINYWTLRQTLST
jgi:hypothetical protein